MQEKTETKSGSLGGGAMEAGGGDGWTARRAKRGEGHPGSLLLELRTPQGLSGPQFPHQEARDTESLRAPIIMAS